MKTYKMTIAGLERELPICAAGPNLDIAAFVIFGDVEITVASAKALLEKCPAFDYIVTPEAKSIPLAYEMAKQSGKPYFVCRKGAKLYMTDPVSVNVHSITTAKVQTVFLDGAEGEKLRGKRVLIVDDVISTGESLATSWCSTLTPTSSGSAPFLPKATPPTARTSSSWRSCRCSSNNRTRRRKR